MRRARAEEGRRIVGEIARPKLGGELGRACRKARRRDKSLECSTLCSKSSQARIVEAFARSRVLMMRWVSFSIPRHRAAYTRLSPLGIYSLSRAGRRKRFMEHRD